jgi:hypothetical protein
MFRKIRTPKIFCIGSNKTGTTTLESLFLEFGFKVGDQEQAELLLKHYSSGNWKPIINFCNSADAFQDSPFSFPFTWLILREHFPDAKFILTERSTEDWYRSLVNHHSKSFGDGINPPTATQLKNAMYRGRYQGAIYQVMKSVYKTSDDDLYNRKKLIEVYNMHNLMINHFFKGMSNFISIDVRNNDDLHRLVDFLGVETRTKVFPHMNKRR